MKPLSNRELFQAISSNEDSIVPSPICKQYSHLTVNRQKSTNDVREEEYEGNKRALYKCPYCNKDYFSVTRYEVHFRTHTGEKPYSCDYCNKKFNEKGNLKAHLRIHTGERPFKCIYKECTMSFKTKGQLNDHSHRHSNNRPFKCSECSSAFNRKTRLKVHMMIHTGQKPFRCPYPSCCKDFREKGNLTSHIKKHYLRDEKPSKTVLKENSSDSTSSNNDCSQDVNELLEMIYGPELENSNIFNLNLSNEFNYNNITGNGNVNGNGNGYIYSNITNILGNNNINNQNSNSLYSNSIQNPLIFN